MSNERGPSFLTEEWLSNYKEMVEENETVEKSTKHADFTSLIQIGDKRYLLEVDKGRVDWIEEPTMADPYDFSVKGDGDTWQEFVQESNPEYANIFSMMLQGTMSQLEHLQGERDNEIILEGDYRKLFANMHPLYEIISVMKEVDT